MIDYAYTLKSTSGGDDLPSALFKLSSVVHTETLQQVYFIMAGLAPAFQCFSSRDSADARVAAVELPQYGCTDSVAVGFDSTATADDGSCDYSAVMFRHIVEGESFSLSFSVFDAESSAHNIQVIVDVADGESALLFPEDSIDRQGTSDQRTMVFTPAARQYGHAVMRVRVTDGVQFGQVSRHGLQLQSPWPTAAIPMAKPHCSCKLTRC